MDADRGTAGEYPFLDFLGQMIEGIQAGDFAYETFGPESFVIEFRSDSLGPGGIIADEEEVGEVFAPDFGEEVGAVPGIADFRAYACVWADVEVGAVGEFDDPGGEGEVPDTVAAEFPVLGKYHLRQVTEQRCACLGDTRSRRCRSIMM